MKKIILMAVAVLGFAVAGAAQPRAVGIRGGYGLEASYQHTLGENFIEADLGLYTFTAVNLGATYNWMIAQPQWTDRGEWGVYAGPGANLGLGLNGWFNVAVCGQVGLEYTFWFPLQLSVDIRPSLGFSTGDEPLYFGGFYPCIGVRYKF
jgi:hypothetical protein